MGVGSSLPVFFEEMGEGGSFAADHFELFISDFEKVFLRDSLSIDLLTQGGYFLLLNTVLP